MQQTIAEMQSTLMKTPSEWIRRLVTIPPIAEHTGIYRLHLEAQATLCTAVVRESVRKPPHVGLPEWVAAQTVGIYEEVLWLCAIMDDLCVLECCQRMSAGKHVHYSWQDGPGAEVEKLSAVDYQRRLCEYAHKILTNRDMIPQDGRPFPEYFLPEMKTLLKRFFRIYAHIYIHHFKIFQDNGCEAHLNCVYKQFLFFVKEFDLVSDEDMAPLRELNMKFLMQHAEELAQAERRDAAQAAEEQRRRHCAALGGYQ